MKQKLKKSGFTLVELMVANRSDRTGTVTASDGLHAAE
ncbi:MAG: type II secretion system protein [Planctomycetota bacterium]